MRSVLVAAALLAQVAATATAMAQSGGDPLLPPPDLGASGVPVPPDSTVPGRAPMGPAPGGYMAVPVPPSTCGALAAMVKSQGVVLIPTGNGNARRYVRDQTFCQQDQTTVPAWVPTDDNPRCFIGYKCKEEDDEGSF